MNIKAELARIAEDIKPPLQSKMDYKVKPPKLEVPDIVTIPELSEELQAVLAEVERLQTRKDEVMAVIETVKKRHKEEIAGHEKENSELAVQIKEEAQKFDTMLTTPVGTAFAKVKDNVIFVKRAVEVGTVLPDDKWRLTKLYELLAEMKIDIKPLQETLDRLANAATRHPTTPTGIVGKFPYKQSDLRDILIRVKSFFSDLWTAARNMIFRTSHLVETSNELRATVES